MKLLVITQRVDRADQSLGFFHRWIEELAKRFDTVSVIALGVGEHALPSNVTVKSLGKESAPSGKLDYSLRFLKALFTTPRDYDAVFVHMNEEYVLLGGLFWRMWGKKICLWRNHPHGSLFTRIAVVLAHTVFCVSEFAYVRYSRKSVVMPAGIDLQLFTDSHAQRERAALSLGRISPVKKLETIVDAFAGTHIPLSIYGNAPARDSEYAKMIRQRFTGKVNPGVPYEQTAELYNRFEAYVNATPTGSYDKAVLEAAACGCIPVVSNRSFTDKLPHECLFAEGDSADLRAKIQSLFALPENARSSIRERCKQFVRDEQSLDALMAKLVPILTNHS